MAGSNNDSTSPAPPPDPPYTIRLTMRFLAISLLVCVSVAFTVGRIARVILVECPVAIDDNAAIIVERADNAPEDLQTVLPTPLLLEGKSIPTIIYTAKHFDTSKASTTNSQFLEKQDATTSSQSDDETVGTPPPTEESTCGGSESGLQCSRGFTTEASDDSPHLPAGQHLLIDIANVSYSFLNSEVRLAQAMIDVVNLSKLTLLSYHCHSLIPVGVSCVGVLLESHVSFHTWPAEGVITLDLFTCGSGELVPVLPIIEGLFSIPRNKVVLGEGVWNGGPVMRWSHILRGFRDGEEGNYLSTELGKDYLQDMSYTLKETVTSTKTKFQHIDIYNLVNPKVLSHESYLRSHHSNSSTYHSTNPDLFRPNRIVFLDGVLQSTLNGLEAYHEALVHPAMFAHPNPRRVAIIGGGEGATLKEALKHSSVEMVKMIEIDGEMVQTSREYLPEWSDCSDLDGTSGGWCGDDDRADVVCEDAMAWFMDRFGDQREEVAEEDREEPFDILIMDALDPQDNVPFADVLYNDQNFIIALYNALSDDGIIVLQLGMAPQINSPAEDFSINARRDTLTQSLVDIGFKSLHMYEEGACGFEDPWTYLIAMKDRNHRANWFRNVAELDYEIWSRMLLTHSGAPALKFFDSNTMQRYQIPNKSHEVVFCRKEPVPESCSTFTRDRQVVDVPISDFEVKGSTIGNHGGRGTFTKVDIKKGSILAEMDNLKTLHLRPYTVERLENLHYYSSDSAKFNLGRILDYVYGYGWNTLSSGTHEYYTDSGILTFVNHGCDGTWNIVANNHETVMTKIRKRLSERNTQPEHYDMWQPGRELFDPYMDRHILHNDAYPSFASRDIMAGDELLDNYVFHTSTSDWYEYSEYLRRVCDGEVQGEIFENETKRKEDVDKDY